MERSASTTEAPAAASPSPRTGTGPRYAASAGPAFPAPPAAAAPPRPGDLSASTPLGTGRSPGRGRTSGSRASPPRSLARHLLHVRRTETRRDGRIPVGLQGWHVARTTVSRRDQPAAPGCRRHSAKRGGRGPKLVHVRSTSPSRLSCTPGQPDRQDLERAELQLDHAAWDGELAGGPFEQGGGGRGHGGEVRRESGPGAATHGCVQPHDGVARTVVGELDRLGDDPVVVDRDERLDGAAAGERPKRQVEAVALAG